MEKCWSYWGKNYSPLDKLSLLQMAKYFKIFLPSGHTVVHQYSWTIIMSILGSVCSSKIVVQSWWKLQRSGGPLTHCINLSFSFSLSLLVHRPPPTLWTDKKWMTKIWQYCLPRVKAIIFRMVLGRQITANKSRKLSFCIKFYNLYDFKKYFCDQSYYQQFTIVIYNSRGVLSRKLPILWLQSRILRS